MTQAHLCCPAEDPEEPLSRKGMTQTHLCCPAEDPEEPLSLEDDEVADSTRLKAVGVGCDTGGKITEVVGYERRRRRRDDLGDSEEAGELLWVPTLSRCWGLGGAREAIWASAFCSARVRLTITSSSSRGSS